MRLSGILKFRSTPAYRLANSLVLGVIAVWFLLLPGLILWDDLDDPFLKKPGIPKKAWRMHRYLTPRIEQWAKKRVASGKAAHLELYDVPSTEWPIFTCVFYLWATEALQEAWEKDHRLSPVAPKEYSRATLESAKNLILDPAHHTWVCQHWGNNYMHTQDVFFRSLVIAGITSYEKLAGHGEFRPLLLDQVNTLSEELNKSPLGLLEDYPGECYPIDVLPAIAWIKRGDQLLGMDRSPFYSRSLRGFQGARLDSRGLVPYCAEALTGNQIEPSRGIGNSHFLISAPELWPEQAKTWYDLYEKHFWQERWWAAGFREYPKDFTNSSWFDVDSGPIIDGFSISGNAFGVAAARINGRFDHAYTLSAQVLTACWPLPNGMQLGARAMSFPGIGHAPYLGETAIMYFLTQNPPPGVKIIQGGHWVGAVYLALLFYLGGGSLLLWVSIKGIRSRFKEGKMQKFTS